MYNREVTYHEINSLQNQAATTAHNSKQNSPCADFRFATLSNFLVLLLNATVLTAAVNINDVPFQA